MAAFKRLECGALTRERAAKMQQKSVRACTWPCTATWGSQSCHTAIGHALFFFLFPFFLHWVGVGVLDKICFSPGVRYGNGHTWTGLGLGCNKESETSRFTTPLFFPFLFTSAALGHLLLYRV
ncbi:uncharacterized protein TRIVIDRAFT_216402, partial [Trichoderma virens Gv29-8]